MFKLIVIYKHFKPECFFPILKYENVVQLFGKTIVKKELQLKLNSTKHEENKNLTYQLRRRR